MAEISFKCKKCRKEFDCEVGKITFGMRLGFEKEIICPNCGKLKTDEQNCELELTEWGQTQVGELYFSEGENDNPFPLVEFIVPDEQQTGALEKAQNEGRRKLGRNEPCHCGSRLKYKKCCLDEDIEKYGHAIKI